MSAPTVNPAQFGFAPPHNLLTQRPVAPPPVQPGMTPVPNAAMGGQNASNPSGPNGMFPINNTPPPAVEPTVDPTQFAIQPPMQPTTSDGVPTPLPGISQPAGVAQPAPKLPLPAGHQMAINRLRGVGHHSRPY